MRITVVGDGKVGHSLAKNLAKEDHDVVIVDRSEEVLQRSEDTLDVLCVRGNGADAKTLLEADVAHSDILIAATAGDETNMLCCLIGKRLGAKYAIARIRDPEYNESLSLFQQELGIDMAINPERATALEISRLLRFPFADGIESFAKGRVEMVAFHVHENDLVVGCPLKSLSHARPGIPQVLYCALERGEEVIIPDGDCVIQPGDRVHVASDIVTITSYFHFLGKHTLRVKSVMLLGGGRISYYLARLIEPMGMRVSIIEINEDKAEELSQLLPDANIICGDGTDWELLEQEGLADMDVLVALCNRDEDNLIVGLSAAHAGVPKVIVKNSRMGFSTLFGSLGLESIVSPKAITCDVILRYVRAHAGSAGMAVEKLYRLMDGKAEALEFVVAAGEPYIGIPLKKLHKQPHTLIAAIVREGKVIIPFGSDTIEAGDSVIVVVRESGISDLNEVIFP